MRVILDTNVLISGIFFKGYPLAILEQWAAGGFILLISADILSEYRRVCRELSVSFPTNRTEPILSIISANAEMVSAPALPSQVCEDPDDDKFLACAQCGRADFIVTGDKLLLKVGRYADIPLVKPAAFIKILGHG